MTELASLFQGKESAVDDVVRVARVIKVDKHELTVDFGSGVDGTIVTAVDSCNPLPDQNVVILMVGNRPLAVGVVGGAYRQGSMVATSDAAYTVNGLINGVAGAATKSGSWSAVPGNRYPLMWYPDAGGLIVLPDPGTGFIPPPPGSNTGGGGTGGGSAPGTYTTTYAATSSASYITSGGGYAYGNLVLGSGRQGLYAYGLGRFRELASKTILSARINLPRVSGSGSVTLQANVAGSSTVSTGGWVTLPVARAQELTSSGTPAVTITGYGALAGTPSGGTIQITWR